MRKLVEWRRQKCQSGHHKVSLSEGTLRNAERMDSNVRKREAKSNTEVTQRGLVNQILEAEHKI